MSRYAAIARPPTGDRKAWDDDPYDLGLVIRPESLMVTPAGPVRTGPVDEHGRAIYRFPEEIGFTRKRGA